MARKFSDRTMAICGKILSELFSDAELQNFFLGLVYLIFIVVYPKVQGS
ncbi:hypothetical protein [Thermoanaerobacter sp. RKWS2]|nr:hypothetical protein [Thermoanaerobacter sp. RKWS2]UZQ83666.1 hypothetical protein OEI98_000777 [Thermoanaerobacter sp. RKWS2]